MFQGIESQAAAYPHEPHFQQPVTEVGTKRHEAIKELVSTEEAYLNDMLTVKEVSNRRSAFVFTPSNVIICRYNA